MSVVLMTLSGLPNILTIFVAPMAGAKYGRGDRDVFKIEYKTDTFWFAHGMEIRKIPDVSSAFSRLGSGSLAAATLFTIATMNYLI